MRAVLYLLLGWLFTVATAYSLGNLLLDRLRVKLEPAVRCFFAFTVGAALLSAAVFLLCSLHLAYKGVFLALGISAMVLGLRTHSLPRPRFHWPLLGFGTYGILYFVNAMAPESSPDGVTYHLGIVTRAYRDRGFSGQTISMYTALSQAMEMLFLFAYAFGKHSAAALVHFTFLLSLPAGMVLWALRQGLTGAGVLGAFLVFASPVVGVTGVSAYNDVAAACVLFGVFFAVELWREQRDEGLLVIAGLLAGFGYGLKYTAGIGTLFAAAYVLWFARQIRPAAIVAISALVLVAPWMIRNAVSIGNPVAPFFNSTFSNPHFDSLFERLYKRDMREFNGVKLHEVWWEATIDGGKLGGLLGPVFLLLPLAALAAMQRAGRRLLAAGFFFLLPYLANISTRFLIPSLPFLALALSVPLMRFPAVGIGVAAVHAVISWPGVIDRYSHPYAWRILGFPIREALRRIPEDVYLSSKERGYILARTVEAKVPAGAKVFEFNNWISEAYTTREAVVSFQSTLGRRLTEVIYGAINTHYYPEHAWTWNFVPEQVRRLRVVQTGSHETDDWSVGEFRVYSAGREIPRSGEWRLRSSHNIWRVQDAFDNNPLTRWRSADPHRPGMWIEVDFGTPVRVDKIRLDCTPDQWNIDMRVQGGDDGGQWRQLGYGADRIITGSEGRHLRAAATQELRSHGIGYVMIDDTDFFAGDFYSAASLWGWTLIAERAGARLYKVD